MAEFVNTIDALGDNVVIDSIIDRTIAEFKDDQLTRIGDYAFFGCDKLETIELPNVATLGQAVFQGCVSLKRIIPTTLPKVTSLKQTASGSGLFRNCTGLDTVTWPSLEVGEQVELFQGCTSLKSVDLPNLVSCQTGMFNGCKALATLNVPKLTKVVSTFAQDCTSLKLLVLPSVTTCDGSSFFRAGPAIIDLPICTKMNGAYGIGYTDTFKALILRSPTVCVLSANNMFANNKPLANGTGFIYVPRSLVDSYKAATNWSTYASAFRALEDYTVDGTTTGALDESKI